MNNRNLGVCCQQIKSNNKKAAVCQRLKKERKKLMHFVACQESNGWVAKKFVFSFSIMRIAFKALQTNKNVVFCQEFLHKNAVNL
jgi:hypothetical protein